ncbi:fibroblast growth factor 19 [Trichosurus vulpecula]|uniref:fibroblast growth factor 19 n=1 Tax=Trichosurus vulpecula TaxID=9337 RepID=UPI00186AFC31|nr:fibroblast growth factor 19 [Trichosurus vulpecula]XP_036618381.1 fibroblast growth factor 19 [Trichosurus vulpecula]
MALLLTPLLTLSALCLALTVRARPLADPGPHVYYGWGEPIRLRHLYTANRPGLASFFFLRIHRDGRVDGSRSQSELSLLEIKAVALRTVAIKGVHSSRYLCMGDSGKLQGSVRFSADDCTFEEQIRPDGYNVYQSQKYGLPVSLCSDRQRQLFQGKTFLPLSHFLPMISSIPLEAEESGGRRDAFDPEMFSSPLETDSMDPFGLAFKLSPIKSPSFQK